MTVLKTNVAVVSRVTDADAADSSKQVEINPKSGWERLQEIMWDGQRSKEEKKLVQKLDLYIM
jgi:ACS family pantothenate transporter-like MFS transporter